MENKKEPEYLERIRAECESHRRMLYNTGYSTHEDKHPKKQKNILKTIGKSLIPLALAGVIGVSIGGFGAKYEAAPKNSGTAYAYSSESKIANSDSVKIGLEEILNPEELTAEKKEDLGADIKPSYSEMLNSSIENVLYRIPEEKLDYYLKNSRAIHMDEKYLPLVKELSSKFGMDAATLASIIEVESNWNVKCESSWGAASLMQVTRNSSTDQEWKNRYDPRTNISAGIRIWKAKENALSFAEPPEALKQENPSLYWKASWEHFKIVAAAYNGGQSPIIDALDTAKKENGKEYWQQKWSDIEPFITKACDPYYNAYKSKAEEIRYYVEKISKAYTLYSTHFQIEKIAENAGNIPTAEIIKEIKDR
ncbi:MAG: transglycosylase SLT domain-containing protein [Candidatus Woesearchaeota archaeon]|nr:transglycosylase SLT domain-containing protein [Candidatus Woesearchaeota archaeon]